MSQSNDSEVAELACTYAALILHDDEQPVTADKINQILAAANVTVQPFWPGLFANVLGKAKLDDLILSAGGSGGSAPAASTGAPAAAADSKAPAAKEEAKGKKKEPEPEPEEEDGEMGFGLFD
eukprot:TRINITY_DN659_c0_g1_i2.p1 TRINITY_DN659_c0_g1~~TRINITY_DN659_c0_g1_i2.p1  ORF type:complete len:123 (+),score=49.53 TRINITY_DN659_c0_g1_i2:114-482(+)